MNLFVYGTLMDPEIMAQAAGETYRSQRATLFQYVRKTLRGEIYPAIIRQPSGAVAGLIYYDVSSAAMARLDRFEGPLYVRSEVVALSAAGERVATYTYVIASDSAHRLSADDWCFEAFMQNHKQIFQDDYSGYALLG